MQLCRESNVIVTFMESARHIWLPSLRVWAQVPVQMQPSTSRADPPIKHRAQQDISHSIPAKPLPCPLPADSAGEPDDVSCPICFQSIGDCRSAVLWWCMHRFCVVCIEKWSSQQRFCPLCKRTFEGWYEHILGSPESVEKPLPSSLPAPSSYLRRSRHVLGLRPRFRDFRLTASRSYRRSLPVQRRRSFGSSRPSDKETELLAAEKALKWRASIYERGLSAIPVHLDGRAIQPQISLNDLETKARVMRRLQPWIHRELQAILGDPEPSVLVQVVLSLWFLLLSQRGNNCKESTLSQNKRVKTSEKFQEEDAIRQLKPFLEDKTLQFWHEFKCFAEGPFTMKAYDSVVTYHQNRKNHSCLRDLSYKA